jgi:hypothetical protein
MQLSINLSFKTFKTLSPKFKIHNMFRPIWPSSGDKICLLGKLLLLHVPRMRMSVAVCASCSLSWLLRCVSRSTDKAVALTYNLRTTRARKLIQLDEEIKYMWQLHSFHIQPLTVSTMDVDPLNLTEELENLKLKILPQSCCKIFHDCLLITVVFVDMSTWLNPYSYDVHPFYVKTRN